MKIIFKQVRPVITRGSRSLRLSCIHKGVPLCSNHVILSESLEDPLFVRRLLNISGYFEITVSHDAVCRIKCSLDVRTPSFESTLK